MVRDGAGVISLDGAHAKGRVTIYPTEDMSFDEFNKKLNSIETETVGKVDKNKKFTPTNNH